MTTGERKRRGAGSGPESSRENARQGYLNGRPKFGFDVEVIADSKRKKRKPIINEGEAALIRRMFSTAAGGSGTLEIAKALNIDGFRQRSGKRWSKQAVLDVLHDTAHRGEYVVNKRDWKNGGFRPREGWITIQVPPIVSSGLWDQVAGVLTARSPTVVNPAVAGSRILLSGLCRCGQCGSAMTLECGKSGRYRYYQCRKRLREGKDACAGNRIPVKNLDEALLNHLRLQLFRPDRVTQMLETLSASLDDLRAGRLAQAKALEAQLRGVDVRLNNHILAIENRLVTEGDVGARIQELRAQEQALREELAQVGDPARLPNIPTDAATVDRFTDNIERLFLGEDQTFARHYLRTVLEKVVVDDRIVHVYAKAAGVAQVAVHKKEEADELLTSTASVPSTVLLELRQTDSNRRPGG